MRGRVHPQRGTSDASSDLHLGGIGLEMICRRWGLVFVRIGQCCNHFARRVCRIYADRITAQRHDWRGDWIYWLGWYGGRGGRHMRFAGARFRAEGIVERTFEVNGRPELQRLFIDLSLKPGRNSETDVRGDDG